MKMKWLWLTWTYFTVGVLIALEVLFILFNTTFIIPKFQKLMHDGTIDRSFIDEQGFSWMPSFVNRLLDVINNLSIWWFIPPALAWALFEWRVKSENKAFMRLAMLGTIAAALMVVVALTSETMVMSYCLGAPPVKMARPFALQQIAEVDESMAALELGLAAKNWDAMQQPMDRASHALHRLTVGPAIPSLPSTPNALSVQAIREDVQAASESLGEMQQAIREKDAERAQTALQQFHESYDPVANAAKPPK